MTRSVTVSLPPWRRVLTVLAVLGLLFLIVLGGFLVGLRLLGPGPAEGLDAAARVHQVHLDDGSVYLGRIVSEGDGYVRLGVPAVIRPSDAEQQDPRGPQLIVQLLATEPYSLSGDVLIARSQVTLVGPVIAGSGLETAYRQATGELPPPPAPAPQPSPGRSP